MPFSMLSNYLGETKNWLSRWITPFYNADSTSILNEPLEIPSETLAKGRVDVDPNSNLRLRFEINSDNSQTKIFSNETALNSYLKRHPSISVWHITDQRSGESYYRYYAWGEWNRYGELEALYQDISSGTTDGIFEIREMSGATQESLFIQRHRGHFENIATRESALLQLQQKKLQRQKWQGVLAGITIGSAFSSIAAAGVSFFKQNTPQASEWHDPLSLMVTHSGSLANVMASTLTATWGCHQSSGHWCLTPVTVMTLSQLVTGNQASMIEKRDQPVSKVGSIPDQTAYVGQTFSLPLDSYFYEPDGDRLSYSYSLTSGGSQPAWLNLVYNNSMVPSLTGTYSGIAGENRGIAISGSYAYFFVVNSNPALRVIDITDPTNLNNMVGSLNMTTSAGTIAISGSYAYLGMNSNGLKVIDISDPAHPSLAGSYAWNVYGIAIADPYLYLTYFTTGTGGFRIVDKSNPLSLTSVNTYNLLNAYGVTVSGSYAYVGTASGLRILNISNPASISLTGSYNSGNSIYLTVRGSYAYLATSSGGSGFQIINISNPASPSLVGSYATGSSFSTLVSGSYAYVSTYSSGSGFQVLDISNPASPSSSYSNNVGASVNLALAGRYAYVGAGTGLRSFRIIGDNTLKGTPPLGSQGVYPINITVTDSLGNSASSIFSLTVQNRAPILNAPIANQTKNVGVPFNVSFSGTTFTDPDSDPLSYYAELLGGFALPEWLNFSAILRSFSGTAPGGSQGTYSILVTAQDVYNFNATTQFQWTISNRAPFVNRALTNQLAYVDYPFSYIFANDSFLDLDNDLLHYNASLQDGSDWPSWLNFNSSARNFYGTASSASAPITILVNAMDPFGGAASNTFSLGTSFSATTGPVSTTAQTTGTTGTTAVQTTGTTGTTAAQTTGTTGTTAAQTTGTTGTTAAQTTGTTGTTAVQTTGTTAELPTTGWVTTGTTSPVDSSTTGLMTTGTTAVNLETTGEFSTTTATGVTDVTTDATTSTTSEIGTTSDETSTTGVSESSPTATVTTNPLATTAATTPVETTSTTTSRTGEPNNLNPLSSSTPENSSLPVILGTAAGAVGVLGLAVTFWGVKRYQNQKRVREKNGLELESYVKNSNSSVRNSISAASISSISGIFSSSSLHSSTESLLKGQQTKLTGSSDSNLASGYSLTESVEKLHLIGKKYNVHDKETLGNGRFGDIYRARKVVLANEGYKEIGSPLAAKHVHGENVASSVYEAQIHRHLTGLQGVVPWLDAVLYVNESDSIYNTEESEVWIFMPCAEFGNGEDLKDALILWEKLKENEKWASAAGEYLAWQRLNIEDYINNKALKESVCRHFARQLLTAMQRIHEEKNVAHNDLKLSNILIARGLKVLVSDFGCAKHFQQPLITGPIHGDYHVRSPERLRQDKLPDHEQIVNAIQSDIWSIGFILLEMLTGYHPFANVTAEEMVALALSGNLMASLNQIPEFVNPPKNSLWEIIRGFLTWDASQRLKIDVALSHPWLQADTFINPQERLHLFKFLKGLNVCYATWARSHGNILKGHTNTVAQHASQQSKNAFYGAQGMPKAEDMNSFYKLNKKVVNFYKNEEAIAHFEAEENKPEENDSPAVNFKSM